MDGLEVLDHTGEGYHTAFTFESWRVAFLNRAQRFTSQGISYLERHTGTDEVFVLLAGQAELLIGPSAEKVQMHKGRLYAVKMNTWHNIIVSDDAKVLIVENGDTGAENTEYLPYRL